MRHWKWNLITAVLVVLVLSLPAAMATDYHWNTGHSNWSTAGNWTPIGPPGAADRAFVGTQHFASEAYLTGFSSVNFLSVEDDFGGINWVWTNGNRLLVYDTTNLMETTGSVMLYVGSGAAINDFDTNYLNIYGGAELNMNGGLAQIDNQLVVTSSSYIVGYGIIDFNSSDPQALALSGTLRTDTGTLTLQMSGTGKLDLGGSSTIDVTSGTSSLNVDGQQAYPFGGTMIIGEGNTVDFTQAWTHSGTLNFNAVAGIATLSGATVTVNNTINVNSGIGKISADVIFDPGMVVNVAAGTSLWLNSDTTYNGSSNTYAGAGTLSQYGDATIATNTTIGTTIFDWDGSGVSETTVNSGVTFTINSDKIELGTDGFDGTVNINGGTLTVNTTDPWKMEGTMNLNYTGIYIPQVSGQEMIVRDSAVGEGIKATGGTARIHCPVTFESTAAVTVDAGATLSFYGTTTYQGGSYTGGGTMRQTSNATVETDTTISTTIYDWDGSGSSETTVNSGATFTIDSDRIDLGSPSTDGFDGTVTVNGGTLVVNTPDPWRMEGTMNLNYDSATPELHGSEMILTSTGTLNLTGLSSKVYAPITVEGAVNSTYGRLYGTTVFESTANVSIPFGYLVLDGPATFKGGSYTGAGILYQYNNATVEANTTIGVAIYDWAHTTTINPGINFIINSTSIQYGADNYFAGTVNINNGATLAVNTTDPWELRGAMNLYGGQVTGSEIIVESSIIGYGTIAADDLNNNGNLSANGGTLVLDTTVFPDLDGSSEAGVLEAMSGDIHVMGNLGNQFGFNGQLYVGSGREFRMDNYGLWNNGLITLRGGTYVAPEFTNGSTGTLTIDTASSTLQSDSIFLSGSTTTLNAALHIDGSLTVNPGATVTGWSGLIIDSGSTLNGNGSVDVAVINYGRFEPGTSAGTFTIGSDYAQIAGATLEIEIGGLTPGSQHDQVVVGDTAYLAGGLYLPLIGGYEPDYYDEFEILTASAFIGIFDWIKGVEAFPHKSLAVVYNANDVTVVAAIPGDATLDAGVTGADYTVYTLHYGTGSSWEEGDFNGDGAVTGADYTIYALNYGGSPVPEPTSMLLLALGGLAMLRRQFDVAHRRWKK